MILCEEQTHGLIHSIMILRIKKQFFIHILHVKSLHHFDLHPKSQVYFPFSKQILSRFGNVLRNFIADFSLTVLSKNVV